MSKTPLSKEDLRSARLRSLGINEPPNDSASIPSSATGASTSHAAAITTGNSLQSVASPSSSSSVARLDYQDSELSSAMELSKNEFSLLCDLLFRNSGFVTAEDMNRWCNEGFRFCGKPNFGLMQGYGGPCGVLAVVQAEILRDLFFDDNLLPVSSNFDDLPENVDPTQASFALARGLYRILKRVACETNSIRIVSLKEDVSEVVLRHFSTWQESLLTVTSFTTEERFLAAMTSQELPFHRQFESGAGCLLFLMSCILTRGFSLVQTDMASDPTSSFIGQFGHCNQETLNLLLAGRATSLVLDGSQMLDTTLSLCGIPHQTDIGYLSALEAARYVTVGSFLKRPKLPIWVLGGTSHFTVLFSRNPQCNAESPSELLLETMRRAFKAEDTEGVGFVPSMALRRLLERVATEMPSNVISELLQLHNNQDSVKLARLRGLCQVDGEIILWQGFWTQCSQLLTGRVTLDDLATASHQKQSRSGSGAAAVDLSMFMDEDDGVSGARSRSDSEIARMLQAEFDQQQQGHQPIASTSTQQRILPSSTSATSNVASLDFSTLLGFPRTSNNDGSSGGNGGNNIQLYMHTGSSFNNSNIGSNSNSSDVRSTENSNRPRSDSEVARELQAQFDLEMGEGVQIRVSSESMAVDEPSSKAESGKTVHNEARHQSSVDLDKHPLTRSDSVATEADERYILWHFNGLQGGVLRQVQLFRRRLGDACIGNVVALDATDALAASDGRAFESLLRTRWPGCTLRWEGAEPRLE